MEWYLPIALLPGVGLLILSTTAQMMSLSAEIGSILIEDCTAFRLSIAERKIKQLGRLTKSTSLLYIACACLVFSGMAQVLPEFSSYLYLPDLFLYIGVLMVVWALAILISYGYDLIKIRKIQHDQQGKLQGEVNHSS